jgi:hypothetical protein
MLMSALSLNESLKTSKRWFVFLLFLVSLFVVAGLTGCGGDDEEEEETATEEAAPPPRRPAPAPRTTARKTAPKRGSRSAKNTRGKSTDQQQDSIKVIKKKLPDDKLIDFRFVPSTIGKNNEWDLRYPGALTRRNTFRDIKHGTLLKNAADIEIRKAEEMIEQVSNLPEGARNEVVFKKAKENLKKAEGAFKGNNYLKAKELAQTSQKLAYDSMRMDDDEKESTADLAAEFSYKGSYQDNNERTALITRIDKVTKKDRLYMKRVGELIVDNVIDPTIKQKITYRLLDIFEDHVVMINVLKNQKFNIALNRDYKKNLAKAAEQSFDDAGDGNKSSSVMKSTATKKKSSGSTTSVKKRK